ncbi:MAG TPA: histidine kinase dimerization/phosphoacceptor domain -containing protein [Caulobacteraceae bacterium]
MRFWTPGPLSIRVRLGVAIAIALVPVLLLGVAQSTIDFHKEGQERRASLMAAADRSVAAARARLDGAIVVLETVTPETVGMACAPRLRELMVRTPGMLNMVRLDRFGRVACAADSVGSDPQGARASWFTRLEAGERSVMEAAPANGYVSQPALLVAARATGPNGEFEGALAAFIALSSLRPEMDQTTPLDTQVALIDSAGHFLSRTNGEAFTALPPNWAPQALAKGAYLYYGQDTQGEARVFTITPLLGHDLFAVLSAPSPGPFSWARLNLLSSVLFPLAAFLATLCAVWIAADRVIVRWLHYVERVAAIYAKGRFTVRLLQAEKAPPEIRELAETLDAMAEMIVARDASLHESLAQKDALLREIHHRVKNNLQVITSLLSLQQRALTDPSAREAISDTRQRITAMALIYRALYQGPDLRRVELKAFLEELIAQLIVSDQDSNGSIRTELQADDLVIHPDKLAPLSLFAVEAISNAQKHAFSGRGGTLRVKFRINGEDAELEIADDGGGGDSPPQASGVGRTLMTAFARQLHGRTEIVGNEWGGCTARLTFPTPDIDAGQSGPAKPKRNRAAA